MVVLVDVDVVVVLAAIVMLPRLVVFVLGGFMLLVEEAVVCAVVRVDTVAVLLTMLVVLMRATFVVVVTSTVFGTYTSATNDLTTTLWMSPCFAKLVEIKPAKAVLLAASAPIADAFALTSVPEL